MSHNKFNEIIKIIRNGLACKSLYLNFLAVQVCLDWRLLAWPITEAEVRKETGIQIYSLSFNMVGCVFKAVISLFLFLNFYEADAEFVPQVQQLRVPWVWICLSVKYLDSVAPV